MKSSQSPRCFPWRITVGSAVVLLAACSTTPPPAWQSEAFDALERQRMAYFAGESRTAEREILRAKRALSATGRPDLVARVELIRCGHGHASLDFDTCAAVAALREDMAVEDQPYAVWLTESAGPVDAASLPVQYRDVSRAVNDKARVQALNKIADPVSRLIAAGVLFRRQQLAPGGIEIAIDTASAQGFRRPLLAWLTVELRRAEAAGDATTVERLRRRIALATGG
ncbi:MAG: hypothetical protein ACKVP2_04310 [Burkholderiales bacterium]